jgi:tripartite-type tricarboxylate transporter receptor subunit TctC
MFKHLRVWLLAVAASLGMSLAGAQTAPKFPDRPIRLLVPYAPGGAGDTLAA